MSVPWLLFGIGCCCFVAGVAIVAGIAAALCVAGGLSLLAAMFTALPRFGL